MWILAYGVPADATDEYIKIGESTTIECMKKFCRAIVEVFSILANNMDSLRCWVAWIACIRRGKTVQLHGQDNLQGRSGSPTNILEVVTDYNLWIWHAYFGMPGSNNDINVLKSSKLFSKLAQGSVPLTNYVIQGREYNMSYYLVDGIYPRWSTLVQTIREAQGPMKNLFAAKQEACRKDVERAFGVLQSKFANIAGSSRYWQKDVLHDIMTTFIITHNMIIEDEQDTNIAIRETRSVAEFDFNNF